MSTFPLYRSLYHFINGEFLSLIFFVLGDYDGGFDFEGMVKAVEFVSNTPNESIIARWSKQNSHEIHMRFKVPRFKLLFPPNISSHLSLEYT